jgi:hypothetical protein
MESISPILKDLKTICNICSNTMDKVKESCTKCNTENVQYITNENYNKIIENRKRKEDKIKCDQINKNFTRMYNAVTKYDKLSPNDSNLNNNNISRTQMYVPSSGNINNKNISRSRMFISSSGNINNNNISRTQMYVPSSGNINNKNISRSRMFISSSGNNS